MTILPYEAMGSGLGIGEEISRTEIVAERSYLVPGDYILLI